MRIVLQRSSETQALVVNLSQLMVASTASSTALVRQCDANVTELRDEMRAFRDEMRIRSNGAQGPLAPPTAPVQYLSLPGSPNGPKQLGVDVAVNTIDELLQLNDSLRQSPVRRQTVCVMPRFLQ